MSVSTVPTMCQLFWIVVNSPVVLAKSTGEIALEALSETQQVTMG